MLLALRGTPFLYYGDEIGLPDAPLDPADALDPVPRRTGDPERQPRRLPHADAVERRAGRRLHADGATPWLPLGDTARNVAAQREDPARPCTSCAT